MYNSHTITSIATMIITNNLLNVVSPPFMSGTIFFESLSLLLRFIHSIYIKSYAMCIKLLLFYISNSEISLELDSIQ